MRERKTPQHIPRGDGIWVPNREKSLDTKLQPIRFSRLRNDMTSVSRVTPRTLPKTPETPSPPPNPTRTTSPHILVDYPYRLLLLLTVHEMWFSNHVCPHPSIPFYPPIILIIIDYTIKIFTQTCRWYRVSALSPWSSIRSETELKKTRVNGSRTQPHWYNLLSLIERLHLRT